MQPPFGDTRWGGKSCAPKKRTYGWNRSSNSENRKDPQTREFTRTGRHITATLGFESVARERERAPERDLRLTRRVGTDQPGRSPLRGSVARRTRTGRGEERMEELAAAARSGGVLGGRGCDRESASLDFCEYPLRAEGLGRFGEKWVGSVCA